MVGHGQAGLGQQAVAERLLQRQPGGDDVVEHHPVLPDPGQARTPADLEEPARQLAHLGAQLAGGVRPDPLDAAMAAVDAELPAAEVLMAPPPGLADSHRPHEVEPDRELASRASGARDRGEHGGEIQGVVARTHERGQSSGDLGKCMVPPRRFDN
jgi:hypothetical protein